jgi:hypothetical protein
MELIESLEPPCEVLEVLDDRIHRVKVRFLSGRLQRMPQTLERIMDLAEPGQTICDAQPSNELRWILGFQAHAPKVARRGIEEAIHELSSSL